MKFHAKFQKYTQQIGKVSLRWIKGCDRAGGGWLKNLSHTISMRSERRVKRFGFINHNSTIWFSHSKNVPTVLRGKILHQSTDIHNVIPTWGFFDQSTPRWQQTGFISHLRDCESSSLWRLLEGSRVRGEQRRCTSAAARWPPCALQPRRCCQVEAPGQTLHREELFLKPSSRCATGGGLRAVLGWASLRQTGRLWGTNAHF